MYARLIREHLAALGFIGRYQSHHVEAWMRAEHSTLDALVAFGRFRGEVAAAVACIDAVGPAESEALAQSYGLRAES